MYSLTQSTLVAGIHNYSLDIRMHVLYEVWASYHLVSLRPYLFNSTQLNRLSTICKYYKRPKLTLSWTRYTEQQTHDTWPFGFGYQWPIERNIVMKCFHKHRKWSLATKCLAVLIPVEFGMIAKKISNFSSLKHAVKLKSPLLLSDFLIWFHKTWSNHGWRRCDTKVATVSFTLM